MISRTVKMVISILFFAAHKIYLFTRSLFGRNIPPTLVIITYHPVKAADTVWFEKQMGMLLNAGTPPFS